MSRIFNWLFAFVVVATLSCAAEPVSAEKNTEPKPAAQPAEVKAEKKAEAKPAAQPADVKAEKKAETKPATQPAEAKGGKKEQAKSEKKTTAVASAEEAKKEPVAPHWAINYPESLKRYYGRFLKFDEDDATAMPNAGGAVFIGSSSITMWTQIPEDFADIHAINRGFGGANTSQWLTLYERYAIRYNPATVVFYCGENDIAGKVSPEQVAGNVARIFWSIHNALPEAKLYFISVKPSPLRENLWGEMQKVNTLVSKFCADKSWAVFVDIVPPMLGADGKVRPELFLKDRLHMNRGAYESIWIPALRKAMGLEPLAAAPAKSGEAKK